MKIGVPDRPSLHGRGRLSNDGVPMMPYRQTRVKRLAERARRRAELRRKHEQRRDREMQAKGRVVPLTPADEVGDRAAILPYPAPTGVPNPAVLLERLCARCSVTPLYRTGGCAKLAPALLAQLRRSGSEYLVGIVRSYDLDSCCGLDFIAISDRPLCTDPRCTERHEVTPPMLGWIPHAVRLWVSAGWSAAA
jgi:hypothetical protein